MMRSDFQFEYVVRLMQPGTLCKKRECNYLHISKNKQKKKYFIHNRKYKTLQMFKVRKCIILRKKKKGKFEIEGSNTAKNSW